MDDLFNIKPGHNKTGYNALKRLPKNPTITHFKELLEHHDWLHAFGDTEKYLLPIAKIKLQQFSAEAKSLDASDFKDMNIYRRYALIICMLHQAQRRAKDSLVIMYCRTMAKMHKKAEAKYDLLREQKEEKTKHLLSAFNDVLVICKEATSPESIGATILDAMSNHGGVGSLHIECEEVIAFHSDSYLPLLGVYFAPKRSTLLKLIRVLNIQTASQDQSLINALNTILKHANSRLEYFEDDQLDASFAPEKWKKLIFKKDKKSRWVSQRYLEMAVFSCLSNELRSGDIYIEGAETYSDYRKELLDWESCKLLLDEYCSEVKIPSNSSAFVKQLRDNLTQTANRVDAQFPELTEFIIDANGNPFLKRRGPKQRSSQAIWLAHEISGQQ